MPAQTQPPGIFSLCRWALEYAIRRWMLLATVVGTMLLNVGLNVLKPWPMVLLVDVLQSKTQNKSLPVWVTRLAEFLPGTPTVAHLIGWSVAATVIIFLLSWLTGLASAYANVSLGQRMVYDLAADLFAKLQQLSLRFHASRFVGDNLRRVTADSACISTIIKDALLPVASSVISVVVMFGILWRINPTLTLIALAVVPYMLVVFWLYAQPMLKLSYTEQETEARIYEVVEQTLSAMPVVQAFSREAFNDRRFVQVTDGTLAATLKLTRVQLHFKVLMGLATAVGTAGIYWLGARHAMAGDAGLGAVATVLLFLSYLSSLYDPLSAVAYTSSTIQAAGGSAQRVREVLDAEREVTDKPGAVELEMGSARASRASDRAPRSEQRAPTRVEPGAVARVAVDEASTAARGARALPDVPIVQIENVTFGYEADRPVLRNISLAAKPGETIALVGTTGAGKSTLASLIPRFFDPQAGRVLVDGQDVRDLQLKSLRQHIAIVLQEPFLFPLSVAENIAYSRPHATLVEIEAAARTANAHDFITRLPQGYHTVIGERGATLSGGERQRLSIARALLKNAPILILDEPTSALDLETERSLLEALERLAQGRTTFIIAHRLSLVRRVHRIAVLQEGQIIETGTHEELLAHGGRYAEFYHIQTSRKESDS